MLLIFMAATLLTWQRRACACWFLQEARTFHSYARTIQSWVKIKGNNPLTENYSVLRPEVLSCHNNTVIAQPDLGFLNTLFSANAIVTAGQAVSHCVKNSINDLLDKIITINPSLVRKVYILTDCMSAVTVPDGCGGHTFDFTEQAEQAEQAQQHFANAGMYLVQSINPLCDWSG
ncbi:MAG: hypothetical protein ABIG69_06915 [Bacteroidota bacterium]